MTKTPEQWLEQAAPETRTGIFKLFLGYAPGVGKTYNMLSEAIRRKRRGEDVVIGIIETHGRKGIAELAAQLESVPRRQLEYKGSLFDEMDIDAILARKPGVVLIDELAHTNIEGSRHKKRYEDVLEVLQAKIDVLSTMNIQHLESATPTVMGITGIQVRETVPDWVLERANEIVMADLTPEALQTRMRRGDVYPVDRAEKALANFFRQGNLLALRELALRQVAQSVDRNLESYLTKKHIDQNWGVSERIAVCISSSPAAQNLIARGARLAKGVDASEFFVVHVDTGQESEDGDRQSLAGNIRFAENVNAKVITLKGKDIATALGAFARDYKITQIIFGRTAIRGWGQYLYLNALKRFLRAAPDIDIHIVNQKPR
ncbi:MAG TPA: histidine kinase [Candidatus Angelobacter sp.]|nr:histidine kinase [Candidatus Angelobacter sp.]